MGFKEFISGLFKKAEATEQAVAAYVKEHSGEIAKVMKITDLIYDAVKGSEKMKAVITYFISALNSKCGTKLNADAIGTSATKSVEDEFQKVYNALSTST